MLRMTYEELKAEANRQGYNLIKKSNRPKLLPCTCGHNKRSRWSGVVGMTLECNKCGKQGPSGRTEIEAMNLWNEMILAEMNERRE